MGAAVRGCRLCKLAERRTVAVPGEGSPQAEIMFIGEGPGFNEDQQGRPFVGAAGQLLTEMLRGIDMRREIGRASCRERVEISGGAGWLRKKKRKEQGRGKQLLDRGDKRRVE